MMARRATAKVTLGVATRRGNRCHRPRRATSRHAEAILRRGWRTSMYAVLGGAVTGGGGWRCGQSRQSGPTATPCVLRAAKTYFLTRLEAALGTTQSPTDAFWSPRKEGSKTWRPSTQIGGDENSVVKSKLGRQRAECAHVDVISRRPSHAPGPALRRKRISVLCQRYGHCPSLQLLGSPIIVTIQSARPWPQQTPSRTR